MVSGLLPGFESVAIGHRHPQSERGEAEVLFPIEGIVMELIRNKDCYSYRSFRVFDIWLFAIWGFGIQGKVKHYVLAFAPFNLFFKMRLKFKPFYLEIKRSQ